MTLLDRPHVGWETRDEGNPGDSAPDGVAEIRTAVESFTTAADQRFGQLETVLTELRGRLERAETVLRRPGAGGAGGSGAGGERAEAELEQRAFRSFLRHGREAMEAVEVRSLRVSDDTAGGYLVPDQFLTELLRNVVLFSPVRSIARVAPISAAAALLPKRTARMTANWVGEAQARTETTITYGQNRYDVRELACWVDVSNQMLEDSAFDIVAELSFDFAEEFGRAESAAFVNGTGVLQPFGFMNDTTVSNKAWVVGSGAGQMDPLIDAFHSLPAPYRANAVWGMSAATLSFLRKFKTASTLQYLLDINGINGAPATTLLGRPIVEMPDLPDVNLSTGTTCIVFGDFMNGYRIFDRVALSVLRDPYSQATNGMTRFHGRRRVAGGIAKSEALIKITVSQS